MTTNGSTFLERIITKKLKSKSDSLVKAVNSLLTHPDVHLHDRRLVVNYVKALLSEDHPDSYACVQRLTSMTHLVWERLNTGHWAQVWPGWRTLYGLLTLARVEAVTRLSRDNALGDDSDLTRDLVKMCDMGLLLGGPDILGGLLESLAQVMTEHLATLCDLQEGERESKKPRLSICDTSKLYNLNEASLKLTLPLQDIPVLNCPDIAEFVTEAKLPARVTKLTGAMEDWPALTSWSPQRLVRLAGPRTVPVEIGGRYTDADWTQELMTVQQFVDNFLCDNNEDRRVGYLAQHQLLSQVPALKEDILTPDYCFTGDSDEEPDINVWIGPGGTVSPAHTDKKHNVLCQVAGFKYVAVFYPDQGPALYPDTTPMFENTSRVDLDSPDMKEFPLLSQLQGHHTILGPGEMLYIPPLVWHYVRSLEQSFSVSFWWE